MKTNEKYDFSRLKWPKSIELMSPETGNEFAVMTYCVVLMRAFCLFSVRRRSVNNILLQKIRFSLRTPLGSDKYISLLGSNENT